jgi:regulator of nonsense transcripts 3
MQQGEGTSAHPNFNAGRGGRRGGRGGRGRGGPPRGG